ILDEAGKEQRNTIPMSAFQYHFSGGFGAYGANETNVYDATVIRLREVTLGYEVPKPFLKKYLKVFGSLRASLSGRNLWFKAPNMLQGLNFDPEVLAAYPELNVQGFDLGAAPSTRRYGVNLTATF
ncbi:MAG: SusC/RagA family TonB-linked outer membrane protein, partial [Williamsia sp.]|nr:SusC/RagA family TonB-linked outer membrane protein [Williamsia sp.]